MKVGSKSGAVEDSKLLIYVVDDEIMVAEVVQAVLNLRAYQVRLFDNPQAALDAFTTADPKPDLLFTDYVMGEMSGLDLIEKCKQLHPPLKTLLYSGSVGHELWEESATKPDNFLSKPFQPKALLDAVHNALRGRPADSM